MIIAMRMRITPINIIHTHPSIPPSPLPLPPPDIHCDPHGEGVDEVDGEGEEVVEEVGEEEAREDGVEVREREEDGEEEIV